MRLSLCSICPPKRLDNAKLSLRGARAYPSQFPSKHPNFTQSGFSASDKERFRDALRGWCAMARLTRRPILNATESAPEELGGKAATPHCLARFRARECE